MFETSWIPKEIAGIRVPKKFRKAVARLPKPSRQLALTAFGSVIVGGLIAGLRRHRHSS